MCVGGGGGGGGANSGRDFQPLKCLLCNNHHVYDIFRMAVNVFRWGQNPSGGQNGDT